VATSADSQKVSAEAEGAVQLVEAKQIGNVQGVQPVAEVQQIGNVQGVQPVLERVDIIATQVASEADDPMDVV